MGLGMYFKTHFMYTIIRVKDNARMNGFPAPLINWQTGLSPPENDLQALSETQPFETI